MSVNRKNQTLAGWLRELPDGMFWQGYRPDYQGLLTAYEIEFGATPNPSTFQRSVAREASERRGAHNQAAG